MALMETIKNNKGPVAAASVVALGVLGWLAFGFFGIQAAFIDNVVDEEGPVFASGAAEVAEADSTADAAADAIESEPATDAGPDAEASAAIEAATDEEAPDALAAAGDEPEDEAPVEEAPAEAEAEEVPVEEAPVEGVEAEGVEEVPVGDAPVQEPVEEPVEENEPGEVRTIFSANFSSLNGYSVAGNASVLNDGTEQRFLVFDDFVSDNGPDLKVYLRADNGEFVSLGDLTGNIGNQNYEIPVDVDLDVFRNVEIWCERFSAGFGVATLAAT